MLSVSPEGTWPGRVRPGLIYQSYDDGGQGQLGEWIGQVNRRFVWGTQVARGVGCLDLVVVIWEGGESPWAPAFQDWGVWIFCFWQPQQSWWVSVQTWRSLVKRTQVRFEWAFCLTTSVGNYPDARSLAVVVQVRQASWIPIKPFGRNGLNFVCKWPDIDLSLVFVCRFCWRNYHLIPLVQPHGSPAEGKSCVFSHVRNTARFTAGHGSGLFSNSPHLHLAVPPFCVHQQREVRSVVVGHGVYPCWACEKFREKRIGSLRGFDVWSGHDWQHHQGCVETGCFSSCWWGKRFVSATRVYLVQCSLSEIHKKRDEIHCCCFYPAMLNKLKDTLRNISRVVLKFTNALKKIANLFKKICEYKPYGIIWAKLFSQVPSAGSTGLFPVLSSWKSDWREAVVRLTQRGCSVGTLPSCEMIQQGSSSSQLWKPEAVSGLSIGLPCKMCAACAWGLRALHAGLTSHGRYLCCISLMHIKSGLKCCLSCIQSKPLQKSVNGWRTWLASATRRWERRTKSAQEFSTTRTKNAGMVAFWRKWNLWGVSCCVPEQAGLQEFSRNHNRALYLSVCACVDTQRGSGSPRCLCVHWQLSDLVSIQRKKLPPLVEEVCHLCKIPKFLCLVVKCAYVATTSAYLPHHFGFRSCFVASEAKRTTEDSSFGDSQSVFLSFQLSKLCVTSLQPSKEPSRQH